MTNFLRVYYVAQKFALFEVKEFEVLSLDRGSGSTSVQPVSSTIVESVSCSNWNNVVGPVLKGVGIGIIQCLFQSLGIIPDVSSNIEL
jgi:hypothetical protein